MGKIKKLKDVELVGGTEQSDVYPITSTKAIYDENNKRLDSIISELQKSADSSLETENKTIVGSINELKRLQDTGYLFKDVATPTTDPGTPKAKVFYIANGKGTYTNFGGLEVTEDEVVVLYWDSSWHKVTTGIASNEKLTKVESNTNPIVYTNDVDVNKVIRKLYINTDNYTGGLSLDGLWIERIVKNVEGYYGFRLQNSKGEDIADILGRTSSDIVEMTVNGIYAYVEYVWANMEDGMIRNYTRLLPCAFVPPTVTKFDITNINQDITELSKKLDIENENIFSYNNNADAISRIISPYDEGNNL